MRKPLSPQAQAVIDAAWIRSLTPLLLALAICAPAHADAFDPDSLPPDPARPGWRPPAPRAYVLGAGVDYDFDPDRGPLLDAHAEDSLWLVTPGAWGAATGPVSLPPPPVVVPPGCRLPAVPGPAPLAVAAGAFTFSRELRKRIHV
jgi:hypothetical protein